MTVLYQSLMHLQQHFALQLHKASADECRIVQRIGTGNDVANASTLLVAFFGLDNSERRSLRRVG